MISDAYTISLLEPVRDWSLKGGLMVPRGVFVVPKGKRNESIVEAVWKSRRTPSTGGRE